MKSTKVQVVFYSALRVFVPPRDGDAEVYIISSSQKAPCTPDSAILEQSERDLNSDPLRALQSRGIRL